MAYPFNFSDSHVAHADEEERTRSGAEQDALQEHEPGAYR